MKCFLVTKLITIAITKNITLYQFSSPFFIKIITLRTKYLTFKRAFPYVYARVSTRAWLVGFLDKNRTNAAQGDMFCETPSTSEMFCVDCLTLQG